MSSRLRRGERGAAAVEFAMVLAPLMLLLMGTVDWGYYFFVRGVVTNAAREGARAGAIVPNATTSQSVANAQAITVATAYLANVGMTAANVTNCPDPAPGGSASVCVAIDYPVGSVTGFLAGMMPGTASVKAIMRLEP
jgi:Flp pilus assembly protein TadG